MLTLRPVPNAGHDLVVFRQPKRARDNRFSKFCAPWTTRYFGQVKNINENVPDMPRFAPFRYQFYRFSPNAHFNNTLPFTFFQTTLDRFGATESTDNHMNKLSRTLPNRLLSCTGIPVVHVGNITCPFCFETCPEQALILYLRCSDLGQLGTCPEWAFMKYLKIISKQVKK